MSTKLPMSLSAVFMAAVGGCGTFLPQEILERFGCDRGGALVLLIQIGGATYWGFAILNWMARSNLIGGIYSRPVAVGNLLHFAVVAITLLKVVIGGSMRMSEVIIGCVIYSGFAVWFGFVAFTHPIQGKNA